MIALDTNVVVRLLVNDHEDQHRLAYDVVAAGPVFVTLAVLMETEWVLRKAYGFSRPEILAALQGLVGLEQLTVDDGRGAKLVLTAFEAGFDFADAVHLVQARPAEKFATFDLALLRKAAESTDLIAVLHLGEGKQ